MEFSFDETSQCVDVDFKRSDLCFDCSVSDNCVLIKAIQFELVYPSQEHLSIQFCDFYKKEEQ